TFPYAPSVIGDGFTGDPNRIKFADIDGDARVELISVDTNGQIKAWWNNKMNGKNTYPYAPSVIGDGFTGDPNRIKFAEIQRHAHHTSPYPPSVIGDGFTGDPNRIKFA